MSKFDYTHKNTVSYLKLQECEVGRVYLLNSRNLRFGVFTPRGEFIGLRHKFGSVFLDAEIHWDHEGDWKGTARPIEPTAFRVPEGILLATYFPDSLDKNTGKIIVYDDNDQVWKDTSGEVVTDPQAVQDPNIDLFDFLTALVLKLLEEERSVKQ